MNTEHTPQKTERRSPDRRPISRLDILFSSGRQRLGKHLKAGRLIVVLGALALAAHVGLVLRHYPLQILLQGEIPLQGDVARYFATAAGTAETGGLYGYDPTSMAGYPVGLWNSMGKKGFEIAHLLLPWIALPRLFYLVIVGLCLLCPVGIWLALRPYAGTPFGRRLLFALTLIFWHLSTDIAYFWSFGNIFFPAAACTLVVMVVLADQVLSNRRPIIAAAALGVMASAVFYAHTVALVAALAPLVALLVLRRAWRLPAIRWGGLLAALAIFAALSVWWLVPLLQTRGDCLAQPKDWFQGGPKYLIMDVFSDRAYGHAFDRNAFYHLAVLAGLAGTVRLWRRALNPVFVALGVGGIAALFITYVGTYLGPMRALQPYRFTIVATLLFLAPAAAAIETGLEILRASEPRVRRVVALLLLLLLPGFTAYLIDLTWSRGSGGVSEDQRAVMDYIKTLPVQGRVLCDDATLGHILPYFTHVSVLGGLSTQAFLKHRFAGIDEDGIGFGRHARDWRAETLKPYLRAYGVEYAILSTRPWVALAKRSGPLFMPLKEIGGFGIYRISGGDPDLLLEGEADVRADYTGIAVSNIRSTPLVIKCHYAAWLTAGPGVRLKPEPIMDDPVPFIRAEVDAGAREFTIRKHSER